MTSRYEKAELLAALWKLSAPEDRIPTSHGILDRALKQCMTALPRGLGDGLTFGVTGVGLRCYELPDILLAAQEAMLTSEPNPTYQSSIVTIDRDRARQIAISYGMSTKDAVKAGQSLYSAVLDAMNRVDRKADQLSVA